MLSASLSCFECFFRHWPNWLSPFTISSLKTPVKKGKSIKMVNRITRTFFIKTSPFLKLYL